MIAAELAKPAESGALLAPVLAAVGAMAALLKDCTIQVERVDSDRR